MSSYPISILEGESAINACKDHSFVEHWKELANSQQQKPTVIQEVEFVRSWYENYQAEYRPLLIFIEQNNNLLALMPLAMASDGRITHVGDHQGEYHGWLSLAEYEEQFIIDTLVYLKQHQKVTSWKWLWMPVNSSTAWTRSPALQKAGVYVALEKTESLIWDLSQKDKLAKMWKSKSNKAKIRRFKKRGNYRFERISEPEVAEGVIKEYMQWQVDFRKEPVNDNLPFGYDRNKADFYSALAHFPNANHFTVLWLDDIPIASHFGQCTDDTVFLGLTAYEPSESKNSPGTILMMELGKLLEEEGYKTFDLTPGAEYKERFANASQTLYQPTVYFSKGAYRKGRIKNRLASFGKYILLEVFKQDKAKLKNRKASLKSFIQSLKNGTYLSRLQRWLSHQEEVVVYRLSPELLKYPWMVELPALNKARDLMHYKDKHPFMSRKELLSEALNHYGKGMKSVSAVDKGKLIMLGWIGGGKIEVPIQGIPLTIGMEGVGVLASPLYVSSEHDFEHAFVSYLKLLCETYRESKEEIMVSLLKHQQLPKMIMEKNLIEKVATFSMSRSLGRPYSMRKVDHAVASPTFEQKVSTEKQH